VTVAVCWKWTARRVDVDPLTGAVVEQPRSHGPSPADEAALEVALRLAAAGEPVVVLCAGPPAAEAALRDALAAGATRAVRMDGLPADAPSDRVAATLAGALRNDHVRLVVCGDRSLDRGSGSVPGFLAAALGAAPALGLTGVEPDDDGLLVTRRLDGGRRERVRVAASEGQPAVVSVEGAAARLRRAPLPGVVAARTATIEVVEVLGGGRAPASTGTTLVRTGPHRPRARLRPGPTDDDPHARILALTGAMTDRTPPVLVHLDPAAAAARILDQLRQWGYEVPTGPGA
jgi:electron transfer flavoprotein beta subunit